MPKSAPLNDAQIPLTLTSSIHLLLSFVVFYCAGAAGEEVVDVMVGWWFWFSDLFGVQSVPCVRCAV